MKQVEKCFCIGKQSRKNKKKSRVWNILGFVTDMLELFVDIAEIFLDDI